MHPLQNSLRMNHQPQKSVLRYQENIPFPVEKMLFPVKTAAKCSHVWYKNDR